MKLNVNARMIFYVLCTRFLFFVLRFWGAFFVPLFGCFCVPLLALGFQSLDSPPSARLLPLGVLSRQFGESLVDARAENSADPKPARGLWQQTFYVVFEAVRIAFWIAVRRTIHRPNIYVYHDFCDCVAPAY